VLCSRDLIQVMPPEERPVDLAALARDLSSSGDVSSNSYMLTLKVPPHELTLFPNGRALIKGAADVAEARSLYARYVGI
jgi:adenylyltransferase/sulfurtransferase